MKNKFFGSKLNTVLLCILIILVISALYVMFKNEVVQLPIFSDIKKTEDSEDVIKKLMEVKGEEIGAVSEEKNSKNLVFLGLYFDTIKYSPIKIGMALPQCDAFCPTVSGYFGDYNTLSFNSAYHGGLSGKISDNANDNLSAEIEQIVSYRKLNKISPEYSDVKINKNGIKYFYTKDKIPSGNQKYIENAIFGLNNKDFPIIMFQTDSGSNITEQEFIDVMDSVIVK